MPTTPTINSHHDAFAYIGEQECVFIPFLLILNTPTLPRSLMSQILIHINPRTRTLAHPLVTKRKGELAHAGECASIRVNVIAYFIHACTCQEKQKTSSPLPACERRRCAPGVQAPTLAMCSDLHRCDDNLWRRSQGCATDGSANATIAVHLHFR